MSTKLYDCYVRLAYVNVDDRLVPATQVVRTDDPDFPGGWQDLVNNNTMAIWKVERTNMARAAAMALAHEVGQAPHGVTKLYDKHQPPATEGGYLVKGGVTHDFD